MKRVGIIGGGVTGLMSAHYLVRRGFSVSVFEKGDTLGGLAGSFEFNGFHLEKYYHHLFTGHDDFVALARELGLEPDLIWRKTRMGFCHDGRIYPFSTPKDLLRFSPLPFFDRLRLGFSLLRMSRLHDWRSLDNVTAIDWLERACGTTVCRVIWEPLLRMKFGDRYNQVSASWLWDRVKARSGSRSQGGGRESLGYLGGGFHRLSEGLAAELQRLGVEIIVNADVEEVVVEHNRVAGIRAGGVTRPFDHVILTLASRVVPRLVPALGASYAASLGAIAYQHTLCTVMRLSEPLSDYYWINVSDPGMPFVGIIEHTNFIPPEKYGGEHIVYLARYLSNRDALHAQSPEEILEDYSGHLEKVFPGWRKKTVTGFHVFRAENTQPVFEKGYAQIKPAHEMPVKNLYLANTSQVYPASRTMNSSLRMARNVTELIGDE